MNKFVIAGMALCMANPLLAQEQKEGAEVSTVEQRIQGYTTALELDEMQKKQLYHLLENGQPEIEKQMEECARIEQDLRAMVMKQEDQIAAMLSDEQAGKFKNMRQDGVAVFHHPACTSAIVNGELRCCAGLPPQKPGEGKKQVTEGRVKGGSPGKPESAPVLKPSR